TMKKALMILSSLLVAVGAFAQGQVNFAARVVGSYDAPVFVDTLSGARASGPGYMAQLYAGASANSLAPVGAALPFRTGTAAGYWTAEARTISTVDATGNAFVQVRAWATAAGATYEAAQALGGGFGSSATLTLKPTAAPDVPATLTGLASFAISPIVPEPSILALGALGGLAMLLRRRK
ncbi:MAG: PEP-CTERM sorting domain-containing protein, partial [Verrucomicrobiota bacterium]